MVARNSRKPVSIATSEVALSFVRAIQKQFAGRVLRPKDRAALREQLAKVEAEELRGIARRIMADLVAPPVQPPAVLEQARPRGGRKTTAQLPGKTAKR